MTRTYDLVLVWTLKNRAWIDRCFQFFAGQLPMWRRDGVSEPDALFGFVHNGAGPDFLVRRLPPGTEIRVTAFANHDLVVTVSSVRRDLHAMLSAYEVANRIGASHAPYAATGMTGSQCRTAFLVRRFAHLTDPDVELLVDNDVVRPELDRVHAAQRQQYEQRGYATAGEPVVFFHDDYDPIAVDGGYFARDPQPGPRGVHGSSTGSSRRTTTRTAPKPLIVQLLQARPAWLTSELAASATQLRMFVTLLQDKGSAATTMHLGDPTRPGTARVTLPIYVPMTDEAEGELAARLQRVARFAETAQVRLRRRCSTCKRSSMTTPACRTTRSTARTRPVLSIAGATAGAAADPATDPGRSRAWSCGRCPRARFEEETIFVCPSCAGMVSPLDALHGCPGCGLTLD